jgi:conjugal transfer pilus assembly protein TraU
MKKYIKILTVLIFLISSNNILAKNCTGKMFNPITDVCWDCIFPISIGAIPIHGLHKRHDTANPTSPICFCPQCVKIIKGVPVPMPGLAIGYWEPIRTVDVTTKPYCLTSLGGLQLIPENLSLQQNGIESANSDDATYHIHWYINPVLSILNILGDGMCRIVTPMFDMAYMTEFDPLFHDDMLSFIINPEAILFANPIAQAACIADAIASSTYKPLDFLFWCAGSQGHLYPFTGNVNGGVSSIQISSLITEKLMAKLHRQLMLPITSGPDAMCQPYPFPIIKKSQYRLQTTFPKVGMGKFGCNPIGKSTILHEQFKKIPYKGEDFGYLIWRKRNCCICPI